MAIFWFASDFPIGASETTHPETTVADVPDRIVLIRQSIEVEAQDAFSLDELAGIERKWRILIRSFWWDPEMLLHEALRENRKPVPGGLRGSEMGTG